MKAGNERTRARKWQRFTARAAVLGLIAAGSLLALGTTAGADTANPGNGTLGTQPTGTAVLNGDGTITVSVTGTWYWGNKKCSDIIQTGFDPSSASDGTAPGWAVSWGDNTANLLTGSTYVGTASDNVVHFGDTSCTDNSGAAPSSGTWAAPLVHTYAAGTTTIAPCVVTYHITQKEYNDSSKKHNGIAGGTNHNTDNSVEDSEVACEPVAFSPDVSVVKSGPTSAVVGTNFTYDLTATNTGAVSVDNVTISDVIPSNLTFVSATSPCTYDAGTKTVTCNVGTLAIAGSATVHITVTPTVAGQDIVNTATVTPDDSTPTDNTSTWTITGANVASLVVTAPVTVSPTFTG